MSGIRLRNMGGGDFRHTFDYPEDATHIARRVPEDEARAAVVAAARALKDALSTREAEIAYESICDALDRVGALTKGDA